MTWRIYEKEVFNDFESKYPDNEILFDQRLRGRYSLVARQVDILVRVKAAGAELIGVYDCKYFGRMVDVKVIDSMVGFLDDLGADFGGIVTVKGFSCGATNRAQNPKLRLVTFTSPEALVNQLVPSLDFSKPENSMYLPLL